jgi:hypothetical protein
MSSGPTIANWTIERLQVADGQQEGSTQLISADGELLGVLTVHFRQPRPLTDA